MELKKGTKTITLPKKPVDEIIAQAVETMKIPETRNPAMAAAFIQAYNSKKKGKG